VAPAVEGEPKAEGSATDGTPNNGESPKAVEPK